jgi:hypothetical protein
MDDFQWQGAGTACAGNGDCLTGVCTWAGFCSRDCKGDDDCAPFPTPNGTKATSNVCVATVRAGESICFPACESDTDCPKSAGLKCVDVGASKKACVPPGDPTMPPPCYPGHADGNCSTSGVSCICGSSCGGNFGGQCKISCMTAQDCIDATGSTAADCMMGNGTGFCDTPL